MSDSGSRADGGKQSNDKQAVLRKRLGKHLTDHLTAHMLGMGLLGVLRAIGGDKNDHLAVKVAEASVDWQHRPPTPTEVAEHEPSGGHWRVIIDDGKGLVFEETVQLRVRGGQLETQVFGTWMPTQDHIILCRPVAAVTAQAASGSSESPSAHVDLEEVKVRAYTKAPSQVNCPHCNAVVLHPNDLFDDGELVAEGCECNCGGKFVVRRAVAVTYETRKA